MFEDQTRGKCALTVFTRVFDVPRLDFKQKHSDLGQRMVVHAQPQTH